MLLGSTHKKREKVDRGNDFNDCCLIPITNTCRVLVLDPTDFTALFLFVSVNRIVLRPPDRTVPERYHLCRHFYIVPTSCASINCISLLQKYIFAVNKLNELINCINSIRSSMQLEWQLQAVGKPIEIARKLLNRKGNS